MNCPAATEGQFDQRGQSSSKIGTTVGGDLPCSPVGTAWASAERRLAAPLTRLRVLPADEASFDPHRYGPAWEQRAAVQPSKTPPQPDAE